MTEEKIEDSIDKLLNEDVIENEITNQNDSLNTKFIEIYQNKDQSNKNSAEKEVKNRPDSKFSGISSSKQLDKNSLIQKITVILKNKNYTKTDILNHFETSEEISKENFCQKITNLIGFELNNSEYNFIWSRISYIKYKNNVIDENFKSNQRFEKAVG